MNCWLTLVPRGKEKTPSMSKKAFNIYRFLPVQLFLLHFRRYHLLLLFWLVLFATITGHFMSGFGADSLFLAPEYLGRISFSSFFLLGIGYGFFVMSWHITTFIIHSKSIPFLGETRNAFVKYCVNNFILPGLFLLIYFPMVIRFLHQEEGFDFKAILSRIVALIFGIVVVNLVSFSYFFRVDRNILKNLLNSFGRLTAIKGIIPYDNLDINSDLVYAESYIDNHRGIKRIPHPYSYSLRFLRAVLRRHHRNAVFFALIGYVLLLITGFFLEWPVLRVPAGCSFLLLFGIVLSFVGSFKYFLRSWEVIGWIGLIAIIFFLSRAGLFDMRSAAYGLDYATKTPAEYSSSHLNQLFDAKAMLRDRNQELARLEQWQLHLKEEKPPLVLISVSGGGSRSAYWSFRCLQYLDSLTGGKLYPHTVFMTGASGGMLGAGFWWALHGKKQEQTDLDVYDLKYQQAIGKDFLNTVVSSMATVDFISPFNKIVVNGERFGKDRGYAFDQELERLGGGLLCQTMGEARSLIAQGKAPLILMSGTILNDGRKLMMAPLPIAYLTRPMQINKKGKPGTVDAVDYQALFNHHHPEHLSLSSALRISATFPVIMPVVKMPTSPALSVMDAGLRDNYGQEATQRYLLNVRDWVQEHCSSVIYLQIRDTKEANPTKPNFDASLPKLFFDPLFAIQQKWSSIQTFSQNYLKEEASFLFPDLIYHQMLIEFELENEERKVSLNFHLSNREKQELRASIYAPKNQEVFEQCRKILNGTNERE